MYSLTPTRCPWNGSIAGDFCDSGRVIRPGSPADLHLQIVVVVNLLDSTNLAQSRRHRLCPLSVTPLQNLKTNENKVIFWWVCFSRG